MNICGCGCGTPCRKTYVHGHYSRTRRKNRAELPLAEIQQAAEVAIEVFDQPPHVGPIDQRRWRLAEMRPGTPTTNPWLKTYCHNCGLPMWTRDAKSTWELGGMCEECAYVLRSEMANDAQARFRRTAVRPINPFEIQ